MPSSLMVQARPVKRPIQFKALLKVIFSTLSVTVVLTSPRSTPLATDSASRITFISVVLRITTSLRRHALSRRSLRHQPGRHALSKPRSFVPPGFLMIFRIVGRWRRFHGFLFLKFVCRSRRFLGILMSLRPRRPCAVRPLSPHAGLLFDVRKNARRCERGSDGIRSDPVSSRSGAALSASSSTT